MVAVTEADGGLLQVVVEIFLVYICNQLNKI